MTTRRPKRTRLRSAEVSDLVRIQGHGADFRADRARVRAQHDDAALRATIEHQRAARRRAHTHIDTPSDETSDREHGEMVAYEGANLYPTEFKDTYPTRR